MMILLSYDDQTHNTCYILTRRGLNEIKYDVPVCHSCRKMIIIIFLVQFIFLNLTLFEFCTLVPFLVYNENWVVLHNRDNY